MEDLRSGSANAAAAPPAANAGGWFGAQVGGTLWIAIGAGVLLAQDARDAAALLWRRRERLPPHS